MLVNCSVYKEGRKVADIPVDDISEYVPRPDHLIWVALKDPQESEIKKMQEEFGLHSLAVEDALRGHQRPKIEEYGDSLFVVLHTLEMTAEGIKKGEVDIFVGANYILSIRNGCERGFASVRERCENEPELFKNGSAFVLYALTDAVVDRYFPIVEELEKHLEEIEDRIFSKAASARLNIEEVYELKRRLVLLHHAAIPLLDALGKLYGGRVPKIFLTMQDYFRDVSDHLIRISKSVEGIRDMSTTAIQVNLSLISLNESETTKKLASYGALFAIPTAIAGIYGMNFKHMPELDWPLGYPLVLFAIAIIDILMWFRFRRAGWL